MNGEERLRVDYARAAALACDTGRDADFPSWTVWQRMPARARAALEARVGVPLPAPPTPVVEGLWAHRTPLEDAWTDEELRAAHARYAAGDRDTGTVRAWRAYQRMAARFRRAKIRAKTTTGDRLSW